MIVLKCHLQGRPHPWEKLKSFWHYRKSDVWILSRHSVVYMAYVTVSCKEATLKMSDTPSSRINSKFIFCTIKITVDHQNHDFNTSKRFLSPDYPGITDQTSSQHLQHCFKSNVTQCCLSITAQWAFWTWSFLINKNWIFIRLFLLFWDLIWFFNAKK